MSNSYKEPFTQITEDQLIKVFEEVFKDSKDIFPEYYYTNHNVKMVKVDGLFMRADAFDKAMKEVLESDVPFTCPRCGSTSKCETPPKGSLVPCTHRFGNIKL